MSSDSDLFDDSGNEQGTDPDEHYILKLFVAGSTPHSRRAIANMERICQDHLKGRYDLEVIDLHKRPDLAVGEQIVVVPTLIKQLPHPLRRLIGDLSETERVLVGLDLVESGT